MPLQSDIVIDVAKFHPGAVSEQTKKFNERLIEIFEGAPKWWEIGPAKYRQLRDRGETALPAPTYLPQSLEITLPSREAGRDIPCRLIYPTSRKTSEERKQCKGSVIHLHGGGWVLGDHKSTDSLLQFYADTGDLAVISVGYRLAPEDPFPKGPEDCIDAGEYLIKTSETEYGGPLHFIGGELRDLYDGTFAPQSFTVGSAGAHLTLVLAFHLLTTHPTLTLTGLLLHFGIYDLTLLPLACQYTKPLVLNHTLLQRFLSTFLPHLSTEDKKSPAISPYYQNLTSFRGRLPKALFTCGTDDPLLDDSVAMGVKWGMSGGEAVVKVYPGAPHAFIAFPAHLFEEAGRAMRDTKTFIEDCMTGIQCVGDFV